MRRFLRWLLGGPRERTLVVIHCLPLHDAERTDLQKRVGDWLDGKSPALLLRTDQTVEVVRVAGDPPADDPRAAPYPPPTAGELGL